MRRLFVVIQTETEGQDKSKEVFMSTVPGGTQREEGRMSKHTEGPWSVRYTSTQDGKGGHCSVSIYKSTKSIVAKRVQGRLTLEDEANATLIAVAPDMLKKLVEAADTIYDLDTTDLSTPFVTELRELIAKAKGEA